jgi:uncharacterized membrane protein (UPF0127 family)
MKIKKKFLIIILVVLLLFLIILMFNFVLNKKAIKKTKISLNKCSFLVETVDDNGSRYKGLSFRNKLKEDEGMLFLFENKEIRTFVMRDMNFPIDIIFISDNEIVNFFENCEPEKKNNLSLYKSSNPVNFVLEVSRGMIDKCKIKEGDVVTY